MFLVLFEVKQVCASWGCIPLASCVRKELDLFLLLYISWKDCFAVFDMKWGSSNCHSSLSCLCFAPQWGI